MMDSIRREIVDRGNFLRPLTCKPVTRSLKHEVVWRLFEVNQSIHLAAVDARGMDGRLRAESWR